jgi:hypothetical protein
MRAEMRVEGANVRAEWKGELAQLRTEVADMRADLKTGLADKPSKTYMWGVLTALLTAYACGLAALAILK